LGGGGLLLHHLFYSGGYMLIAVQDPPTLVVLQQGFENSKLFVMEVIDNQTNKIKARYFYDDSSSLMSAIINHIDFSLEEDECDNLLFRDSCSSIGTSTSEIDRIIEEGTITCYHTKMNRTVDVNSILQAHGADMLRITISTLAQL